MKPYEPIDFELGAEAVSAMEPEALYEVNRELNLAWRIVEETGANLFLTGRAGTGKTTFLRKLREKSSKRMIVLAPTGVAAINASGATIHSFFQLPFAPFVPGEGFLSADKKFYNISKQKRRIISSLSLLVIDEVSMVRPDILDAIDALLRRFRNPTLPFGGVQLLLIGDLRQLPPVIRETDWQFLAPHYSTPYFFDSIALKKAGFHTIELSTVYRQSDRRFIDLLNAVRDGKADTSTLRALNTRYLRGFNPGDNEGYIRLTTHNRIADSVNEDKLRSLDAPLFSFEAEIEGDFPESAFPVERKLRLKKGAQVMFVKNDSGMDRRYYNGLIGTVVELGEDSICVLPTGSDEIIRVGMAEWENTKYVVNEETKNIAQETIGIFRQYPLRLAWAITIHKSQGLTFDRAIIDAALSFAAGQTYVALSRCRSLEGMVLGSPIPPSAVITDKEVNSFIDYCESHAPDAATLTTLRNEYFGSMLAELFDFNVLKLAFADFIRYVTEFIVPLYPDLDETNKEMLQKMNEDIHAVGQKFISLCARQYSDPESLENDKDFRERIKSGCVYFRKHLLKISSYINKLPRNLSNQAYTKRVNNTYDNLAFHLGVKLLVLSTMADKDFSTAAYTTAKAEASLQMETGRRRKPKL